MVTGRIVIYIAQKGTPGSRNSMVKGRKVENHKAYLRKAGRTSQTSNGRQRKLNTKG